MKTIHVSLALFAVLAAAKAQGQTAYSTGFDAPTYTAGTTIVGTDGWITGSSATSQSITSTQSATGGQSLGYDNTGTNNSFYSVRRAYAFAAGTAYTGSVKVYVSGGSGADRLYGMYFSTGTLGGTTLGMTVAGDGGIRAGKTWGATYATAANSVAAPGTYADRWLTMNFSIDAAGTGTTSVSGFSDGSAYSYSFTGVTTASYINLGSDYIGTTARSGTGYFDSFSIAPVPEPSAFAALGLGAAAMLRRRKRA